MGKETKKSTLNKNNVQKPTPDWWLDDGVWVDLFGPLFARDDSLADRAAKLFDYLLLELENEGSMGATRVQICLENALDRIFPYTSVGRTCKILFLVSLGKDFPDKLDTLAVLSEAMKRTRAALQRGPDKQPKRSKRSRR